jgi:hypothetical protein
MKILFDQGVPAPLRNHLVPHEVVTAYEQGWSTLKNGELLNAAEQAGFECMVTTDKNLAYQQNLAFRKIALIILPTTSWPRLKLITDKILYSVSQSTTGSYREIPE